MSDEKFLDDILKELYQEQARQRKEIKALKKSRDYNIDIKAQYIEYVFKIVVYLLFILLVIISLILILK